jgi:hypothetical protein
LKIKLFMSEDIPNAVDLGIALSYNHV